ncbi:hypothetical protein DMH02_012925 [Streptomyces sp. WAC 00631]|nr:MULTISPECIES: hypothetical protein [unclassified Streptomyces]MCC5034104.1 hypothetical protein [Streptomyces sp. WAC 00631]MCC9742511.1 hypothetical protein [Streptomyces sp. MNU89]
MQPVILDTDVASLTHKGKLTGPPATRLIGRKPLITRDLRRADPMERDP